MSNENRIIAKLLDVLLSQFPRSSLAAPHPPSFRSVSVSLASDGPASALLYVVVGYPVTSWRGGVVALLLREPPEGQPRPISPCPAAHQLASPPVDLHLLSLSSIFPSTHGGGGSPPVMGGTHRQSLPACRKAIPPREEILAAGQVVGEGRPTGARYPASCRSHPHGATSRDPPAWRNQK